MKIYGIPPEAPQAPNPDYSNYDRDKEQAAEDAHIAALKAFLVKSGYTGPHTGGIASQHVGDGAAQYMLADGKGIYGPSFLLHLPYGDGYQARDIQYVPKKEIIRRIESEKKLAALFSAKG